MRKEQMLDLMSEYPEINVFEFEGCCIDCQCPVIVTVIRVHDYSLAEYADSFDVYGGAVHGSPDKFQTKCESCFSNDPHFGGKCLVYSRVVGYLTPVKQWNKGQQAQFGKRKMLKWGNTDAN